MQLKISRMKRFIAFILLLTPLFGFGGEDERIEAMLSKMSFDDKIGQLNQVDGRGDIGQLEAEIRAGRLGSVMNIVDPKLLDRLQRIAVEESPAGIPLLFARDVVHGFKTVLPIPLGQAASFDEELVERAARNTAVEATECGIRWAFAPMMDIARDPRWGRIAEGFGEDPFLAGRLAAAVVRGYQGDSLSDPKSMAACAKHFVGYGAAEGGRDYNTTYIPERLLRDIYFPPFRMAVEAGCASVMSSFNDNDGLPATGNRWLLTDVLRGEWGFDGVVVSDWGSVAGLVPHGAAADNREAAKRCITAGTDMDMSSRSYLRHLRSLVENGEVPMEVVDEAVRRILRLKMRLGLFEHPYTRQVTTSDLYSEKILDDACALAREATVLLKNDGVLPLSNVRRILVTGPMADAPYDQMGTWTLDGDKTRTLTPIRALREIAGKEIEILYEPALAYGRDQSTARFGRLRSLARKADVVLAFVGEEQIMSGEAHSLADLNLQGAQREMLELLAGCGRPLVTVFMAGRPLTIERETEISDAVLYAWHPGTMGGRAIAQIILGEASPSGKLPVTFPRCVGQIPMYYNHKHTSHRADGSEGNLDDIPREAVQSVMGHTSSYLDVPPTPLFPFGFGLSYTTFTLSELQLSDTTVPANGVLKVRVTVENRGKREGTEVVQLYVGRKSASVTRPIKELKGFRRVTLSPSESRIIEFELPIDELAFCGADRRTAVEPGSYVLTIGTDSRDGLKEHFSVK